ncbi:MAG TPA: response regulator transcription factor [Pyrinomonadaceae bacterium]|nr:response regulator transcription factor [Pyrinomonadaceae bacterium]
MEPVPLKIRVMLINDQLVVREGLRMLLEKQGDINVVAMAKNRSEALEIARSQACDLIILDLELGGHIAFSLIPQLREAARDARVLLLTGLRDLETHQKAAELGAMGVVLKDNAADLLIKAVEKVYKGEAWFDRVTIGTLLWRWSSQEKDLLDPQKEKIKSLTERELQVIALIAQGLKNRQIAERLFISPTTVTHRLSSIYTKLGVSDRLELMVYAFANKLAKMPE